jgi:2-polyprenyl-3-methyl-5-hydroxy-6-metoxy-1,4-benzoquinol methylase
MTDFNFQVRLPVDAVGLSLDDEYFHIETNGKEHKIGLHEYENIYNIRGLYEYIVSRTLKCVSPEVVSGLLVEQILQSGIGLADISVLDFGAGVGLVGDILARKGVRSIVGLDITAAAAIAARRDYPGVYAEYYVEDVCTLSTAVRKELLDRQFNCLICVGSLACGHISGDVFAQAFNLIDTGGWVAFNILKESYTGQKASGLSELIHRIKESNILEVMVVHEYRHRYLMNGTPVNNVAVIGRKSADI